MTEEPAITPAPETLAEPLAVVAPEDKPAKSGGTDWVGEAKSIAILILAVLGFHSLVAKPFYIPSESMMPVLLKGDRLVVNKFAYGWSYVSFSFHILPAFPGRLFGRLPERGDIVIAQPQGRSEDYIKRVIGLPGDTIEVRAGQVILNGKPVPQVTLPPLTIPNDVNQFCDPRQFPDMIKPIGRAANGKVKYGCVLPVKRETLPNGRSYTIIDVGMRPIADWYGPVKVPADHVFLMGDNRDNSADSRVPLEEAGLGGPVPFESIGGRAEFITFSLDGSTSLDPRTWFSSFRSGRAFTSLHPVRDEKAAGK